VDLVVRGGTLVTREARADIAVDGGQIVAVGEELSEGGRLELDARGLHVFPGLLDLHVHFNEPGRAHWEGLATGSRALAAGSGTLFADMPLNSDPPLLTAKEFHAKKEVAEGVAVTDFALWGGLTPDNLEHLEALADLGVVGFKAFMADSGIPEFRAADDDTLLAGMERAAALGVPVAVHAESEGLTGALTRQARARGERTARAYLRTRPPLAELEAVHRALLFAEETGATLHVVHVSTAAGLAAINEAKARGVDVSAETCPHYLHFTDEDAVARGAVLKCAPPLRSEGERRALWRALARGAVDLIASDHSPSSPELKAHEDFFAVWGGVSGVQSSLSVLLTHHAECGVPLAVLADLTAARPAERFRLPRKGRIEPGFDADLALVDLRYQGALTADRLHTKHKASPYLGETLRGRVVHTLRRGEWLVRDGQLVATKGGRFVRPERGEDAS